MLDLRQLRSDPQGVAVGQDLQVVAQGPYRLPHRHPVREPGRVVAGDHHPPLPGQPRPPEDTDPHRRQLGGIIQDRGTRHGLDAVDRLARLPIAQHGVEQVAHQPAGNGLVQQVRRPLLDQDVHDVWRGR